MFLDVRQLDDTEDPLLKLQDHLDVTGVARIASSTNHDHPKRHRG
jgi:hypothetical protein